jgi:cell wall-associated NlpC family hydrolase
MIIFSAITLVACNRQSNTGLNTRPQAKQSGQQQTIDQTTKSLITLAQQKEGSRYKYGGTGPRTFDCSGFTQYVFSQTGIEIPRRSVDQASAGKKISVDAALPGDLLVFKKGRKVQHIGIVVRSAQGELWVTHASTSRGVITENVLSSPYWKSRIRFARRVLP